MLEQKSQARLYEVDLMRLFLIFILLMDHSFAPFSGMWVPVTGQTEIFSYRIISLLSSSLFLQMFVFISGYVYGMKCRQSASLNVKNEVYKKFKRLIIPSIVFSVIYFLIFEDKHIPLYKIAYMIVNGCGHLWFLPMLFWCFVIVILVEHFKVKPIVALPVAFIVSLLAFAPLPLRVTQSLSFFFFFYLGFAIKRYGVELKQFSTPLFIVISLFLFFLCFFSTKLVTVSGVDENNILPHISRIVIDNILRTIYVVFGLVVIYLISLRLSQRLSEKTQVNVTRFAGYCFGIYIFQQFILKILYYHVYDGSWSLYLLPWVGLVAATIGSTLLTYFTLKTPIGRQMIG